MIRHATPHGPLTEPERADGIVRDHVLNDKTTRKDARIEAGPMTEERMILPALSPLPHRWEPVLWSDTYVIGVPLLDDDHQHLFNIYNALVAAVNRRDNDSRVQNLMHELFDYTDVHFEHEEDLMRRFDYPEYLRHRQEHESFITQLHDVNNHLEVGGMMGAFVLDFLGDWFVEHIRSTDMALGTFLRENGKVAA